MNRKGRILAATPTREEREEISDHFEKSGYSVEFIENEEDLYNRTFDEEYDAILVSFESPELVEVAFRLLEYNGETKILIYGKMDVEAVERAFASGVSDVATGDKPVKEAVIRAIKLIGGFSKTIHAGDMVIDPVRRVVKDAEGNVCSMGDLLFDLLSTLAGKKGEVVTKEELKSFMENPSDASLRVYVNKIKKRFGLDIRNVRGKGYMLN